MLNKIFLLISLLVVTATSNSASLEPALKFSNLSTAQGLSQSYVFSIAQDQQGFIWIATEDGLNRYDGKNFIHYRHKINDKHSIADNMIRKVFVDNKNILWVGTEKGLSRYNRRLDNFDNYLAVDGDQTTLRDNFIWEIYQDNHDILWISSSQSLHQFNPIQNNFKRLTLVNNNHNITDIRTIFQDKNDNYWLGTYDQGIFIANKNLSYIQSLQQKNKWQLNIPTKSLLDIKAIDQHYWLATEQGVFIVDSNYKISRKLTKKSTQNKMLSNEIRTIEEFDDSHVWIGTKKGLNIFNIYTDEIKSYQSGNTPKSLSENLIMDIFKDATNAMWIGNLRTGLDVYHPNSSLFAHKLFNNKNNSISIESIAQSKDGKIWFSSEKSGLNYINKNNKITHFKTSDAYNSPLLITDSNNNLWYLTYQNKNLYQLNKNNKLTVYKNWQNVANYNEEYPFVILNDFLWFTNNDGKLTSYNPENKTFSHYNLNLQQNIQLRALQKDQYNNIWLTASNNKIYQFNITSNAFTALEINPPFDFQINNTINIAIDRNHLWLGSNSQGVMVVDKNLLTTTVFNENNGLINNNPTAILIDQQGNAWLSATNGISVINVSENKIQNFGKDYSLDDNEFMLHSALVVKREFTEEIFYFGGLNGFQQFNPSTILKTTQTIPTPVLTNLFFANKKISIGKNLAPTNKKKQVPFKIPRQVNQLEKLTLAYQQSPFSIEFTSPNVKLPSQIRYRYKLIGLEDNWIEASLNNPIATYTNLNAGHYTFVVQAYDMYFPQQIKSKQLHIEILPPWWLSNQALLIYGLIILLIIGYFVLQIRHRRQYHLQIQQSEERLKLSLWGSGDEMWDWNIISGQIYRSNIWQEVEFPQDGTRNYLKGQQRIAKISPLDSKGKAEQYRKLQNQGNIHPQDIIRVNTAIEEYLTSNKKQADKSVFETTYRVKDKDKHDGWIWVLDRGKVVEYDNNQQPSRMTGTLKDISQIKNAEERLKLFAKCIESISDAVVIYDRQFQIVDVNKAFQKITGESKTHALKQKLRFKRYNESFTNTVKKHVIINGTWQGEIESQRKNNEIYFADLSIDIIRDENNSISHFVGVFSDISERKEAEVELRKLANSDTLTGLPNRSYFQANQTRLVNSKSPHALLVFDLDHFKKINDSLGHEFGDILLCRIGERIINSARDQDTVYRLGGDEFGLIIENTNDIHTITSIAKNILNNIANPLKIKSHELVLHSSIGIVLYPEDGSSPQELLKNADTAMYHAKNKGGNQYEFFNDSMNKQAVKRLQVENLIRYGLKNDNFSVYYQPKIEISTGKIAGMEALVRFEHPSKGIVSPITFIPVSEETGQIIEIGEVVLRKSCYATKTWVDAGLFNGRIAVNLSAVQFTQTNLVAMIADILKETQLPAKYLELEITEGTVMDSPQAAIDIMKQIRAMGIHLSLDDFGTGYSSLAYLKKFPLNTLKIDKAFVDDIEHSEQGRNMVATIITIAHNLDLQVVAEGVEQQLQLDFLTTLNCEQLQGYLYSKPLTESDFYKYLLSHKIANKSTNFNSK